METIKCFRCQHDGSSEMCVKCASTAVHDHPDIFEIICKIMSTDAPSQNERVIARKHKEWRMKREAAKRL